MKQAGAEHKFFVQDLFWLGMNLCFPSRLCHSFLGVLLGSLSLFWGRSYGRQGGHRGAHTDWKNCLSRWQNYNLLKIWCFLCLPLPSSSSSSSVHSLESLSVAEYTAVYFTVCLVRVDLLMSSWAVYTQGGISDMGLKCRSSEEKLRLFNFNFILKSQ